MGRSFDIKPNNILVGHDGNARLADCGLSKPTDMAGYAEELGAVGTPGWATCCWCCCWCGVAPGVVLLLVLLVLLVWLMLPIAVAGGVVVLLVLVLVLPVFLGSVVDASNCRC